MEQWCNGDWQGTTEESRRLTFPTATLFITKHGWNYMGLEESYILGYNAMESVESQPTFRKNMSPPYSGSKNKRSFACCQLHAGFLHGVFFDLEDEGEMLLPKSC
jgi:hypothetical protein